MLWDQWSNLNTDGAFDPAKVNRFLDALVETKLSDYDVYNRDQLAQKIALLHEELRDIRILIEDAEFELAALNAADSDTADGETLDEPPDWCSIMARRGAE